MPRYVFHTRLSAVPQKFLPAGLSSAVWANNGYHDAETGEPMPPPYFWLGVEAEAISITQL